MRRAAVAMVLMLTFAIAGCDREPVAEPTPELPSASNRESEPNNTAPHQPAPATNANNAPPERDDTAQLRKLATSAPIDRYLPHDEVVEVVEVASADALAFESILTRPVRADDNAPIDAPAAGLPAVLIIPPDTAANADGAVASGHLEVAPYRDIAHALAAHGFAVLRMQPRAEALSDRASTITDRGLALRAMRVDQLLADIDAHWTWLTARADIDATRIAVIAHAGATLLACEWVGDRTVPLVLAACPAARPLDAIALRQADTRVTMLESLVRAGRVDAGIPLARERTKRDRVQRAFQAVRGGSDAAPQTQTAADGLPDARGEAYWRAMLALCDSIAARVTALARRTPILALHGDQDLTFLPDHALAMATAMSRAPDRTRALLVPNVNHWLIPIDAAATDAGRVDPLATTAIAGWLATVR